MAISGENKLPSLGTVIIFIIIDLMSQIKTVYIFFSS